ncbi:MAG: RimK family alpha-L-glutamate ligase [Porphyromonadaceae bacterium]|nr:MAG: RimK family alpha-L-glutamate ligase [Porphyromonadaceae bacterium]
MNVLLLTESTDSNATGSLVRAFENRKHTVAIIRPCDIYLFVSSHQSGFDRVYREEKGVINRVIASDYDTVYPRLGDNLRYGCAILDHLHSNVGIFCPIPTSGLLTASDKFETIQKCSQFGIRTPRTLLYSGGDSVDQLIEKIGGMPVVVKQLHGSQGKGVAYLDSMGAVRSTLDSFSKANIPVLVQEYIEASGTDFRVFVVGGKAVASYKRVAARGDFRANISQGGQGIKADISKEEEYMCLMAAQAVGLPIAGVDFLRAKDGQPFLIEVNGNAGFHIEKVTGISVSKAIVAFTEQDFAQHGNDRNKLQQERRDTTQLLQSLTDEAKKTSKIIDPIVNDDYLKEILTQHKGEMLDYTDRSGQKQQRKLNSLTDLIAVMSQTFKIQ